MLCMSIFVMGVLNGYTSHGNSQLTYMSVCCSHICSYYLNVRAACMVCGYIFYMGSE